MISRQSEQQQAQQQHHDQLQAGPAPGASFCIVAPLCRAAPPSTHAASGNHAATPARNLPHIPKRPFAPVVDKVKRRISFKLSLVSAAFKFDGSSRPSREAKLNPDWVPPLVYSNLNKEPNAFAPVVPDAASAAFFTAVWRTPFLDTLEVSKNITWNASADASGKEVALDIILFAAKRTSVDNSTPKRVVEGSFLAVTKPFHVVLSVGAPRHVDCA